MSKRPFQHSKDTEMQIEQQMRAMLWEAVPPRIEDNRKSWLSRAARTLGWGERRTKALFYCEARVVTADEWRVLNERLNAAKRREREQAERGNERSSFIGGMGKSVPLDTREDPPLPIFAEAGPASIAQGNKAK